MKNKKVILLAIIVLAFVLRFWRLDTFPALNADEAALGYNAWSLIQTGMDEHGNSWPVHFQSFNDFKPGLYVYLILPFIKVLGLTTWAVRIPSAALAVATVYVVYLLTTKLVDKKDSAIPLVAAAMLAVSPWHIHFSRGGWEVNTATFFITTAVYFFLLALEKQKYWKYFVVMSVAALYTYHAARVVVPLVGFGLVLMYWKNMLAHLKAVVIAGILGLLLLVPLVRDLTGPAGVSRAAGVGIFSDPGPLNEINEQRGEHEDLSSFGAKLMHNKPVNYTLAFAENYMEHFHGEFLFLSGDEIQRNRVPEHGQMYMIDALFVILGVFAFLKYKLGKVVGLWLLVAPIAAALTFQSPHALRAQNMVIPLVIISAIGLVHSVEWFKKSFKQKSISTLWIVACGLLYLWSFARYQQLYWVHMPRAYPFSSQYGVEALMSYVADHQDEYDTIVITDRYDQPYILTLFYLQYPPSEFQGDHTLTAPDGFGFSTVRSFGKYRFHSIEWPATPNQYPHSLIVGTDEEVPEASNVVETINFPNGDPAFQIVAN